MYYRHTLNNGLKIIAEPISHFHSVSIGLWVGTGSVKENQKQNGMAHFIEHMLFKGTPTRTAKDISVQMDSIGGQLNAFTSKEATCFYAKVMDEHLPLAMDVLCDIFLNSLFDEQEITKEKSVITEEIQMVQDTPDDLVHELLAKSFFNDHPLSKTILGTEKNISSFSRDDILSFMQNEYVPGNTVLSIAGNFEWDRVLELVEHYFGRWKSEHTVQNTAPYQAQCNGIITKKKSIEQIHVCLGYPGVATGSDDLYPLLILNNVFGGSMSSRLFQKIREEKGLAYAVYSYPSAYQKTGMMTVYAGTSPKQVEEVVSLMMQEIEQMREKGISQEEVNMGRDQLKGNYMLGLESTSGRMTAIGKSELLLGRVLSQEEVLKKIEDVTEDDVARLMRHVFSDKCMHISAVGKIPKELDFSKFQSALKI